MTALTGGRGDVAASQSCGTHAALRPAYNTGNGVVCSKLIGNRLTRNALRSGAELGQSGLRLFRRKLAGRQGILNALLCGFKLTGHVGRAGPHKVGGFRLIWSGRAHHPAKRRLRISERVTRAFEVGQIVSNALGGQINRRRLKPRHLGDELRRKLDPLVGKSFGRFKQA